MIAAGTSPELSLNRKVWSPVLPFGSLPNSVVSIFLGVDSMNHLSRVWRKVVALCLVGFAFCNGLAASCVAGPVGIGWTPFGAKTTAGYVAGDGKLLLFDGGAPGWTLRPAPFPHLLVPSAPIALLPQGAGMSWPEVITVSSTNKLIRIVDGGPVGVMLPALTFPVGAHIEVVQNGAQSIAVAVTGTGDLWYVDPATNVGHKINGPAETFLSEPPSPGSLRHRSIICLRSISLERCITTLVREPHGLPLPSPED